MFGPAPLSGPGLKMSGCFLNLPVGTEVKLAGLSNAEYNGKRGRIAVTAPDLMARDRVAVIVDGKTLSFKRANVRRYFPSDDSDESDEAPGSDGEAPPPPKRAKSAAGGVFALSILTGWSSIETSTIVGTYGTWAEVQAKAKEILRGERGRLRGQHVGQGAERQGDGRARVGQALRGRQGKHDPPGPAAVSGDARPARHRRPVCDDSASKLVRNSSYQSTES